MENLKFRNCSRRRIISSIEGNVLLGCFEPADTLSSIMRAIKGIHLAGRVDWRKKNIKDNIIGSARVASSKNLFHGCILEAKFVAVRITITGANKVRGEAEKRVAVSIRSDSYPRCFNAAFTATFLSRPSTARINTVIPRFAIPLKRPCSRSLPRRAARPIPTD